MCGKIVHFILQSRKRLHFPWKYVISEKEEKIRTREKMTRLVASWERGSYFIINVNVCKDGSPKPECGGNRRVERMSL